MAQRAWIPVSNPDTAEWWLNPDHVSSIYRNTNSTNWVICMSDGSDWSVPVDSDAGKAIANVLKGNQ